MTSLSDIISDAEITRVHGHANFGSMDPRQVVNDGVRKTAVGYHCGQTQFCILREHGLITKPRGMSHDVSLTKKGKKYGRALFYGARDDLSEKAQPVQKAHELEREAIIEECAVAAEQQDRVGYEWVRDSLWHVILQRAGANVRALLQPTIGEKL